jgi:uncharacterized protein
MGPKSFEQCAGFLKIPESAEPLDNTWVHPENYPVAREIRNAMTATTSSGNTDGNTKNLNTETVTALKEKFSVGETTVRDIAEELNKPNRDPRDGYPKPVMRKGVLTFEDLTEGMTITGKIKNVVDFGAFVDLGIKETALVHISEMSDRFVKDPLEAVKAGDVLEFRIISLDTERRRIALSRKTRSSEQAAKLPRAVSSEKRARNREQVTGNKEQRTVNREQRPAGGERAGEKMRQGAGRVKAVVKGKPEGRHGSQPPTPHSPLPTPYSPKKDDDGTMYNPFAEAFKKKR